MKKLLLATAALGLFAAPGANAAINVGIGLYQPAPVYYEPAPVYYAPPVYPIYYRDYRNDRRHDYNWGYWNDRDHRDDHGRGHDSHDNRHGDRR